MIAQEKKNFVQKWLDWLSAFVRKHRKATGAVGISVALSIGVALTLHFNQYNIINIDMSGDTVTSGGQQAGKLGSGPAVSREGEKQSQAQTAGETGEVIENDDAVTGKHRQPEQSNDADSDMKNWQREATELAAVEGLKPLIDDWNESEPTALPDNMMGWFDIYHINKGAKIYSRPTVSRVEAHIFSPQWQEVVLYLSNDAYRRFSTSTEKFNITGYTRPRPGEPTRVCVPLSRMVEKAQPRSLPNGDIAVDMRLFPARPTQQPHSRRRFAPHRDKTDKVLSRMSWPKQKSA